MGKSTRVRKNYIYVPLKGRIGNQLFIYSFARSVQLYLGNGYKLIIDDSQVLDRKWLNSLVYYDLPNVEYIHKNRINIKDELLFCILKKIYNKKVDNCDYLEKFIIEKKMNNMFGFFGSFFCENGYIKHEVVKRPKIYIDGYFQSEHYFESDKIEIKQLLNCCQFSELNEYKGIEDIKRRNSVCISIKVEHNINNQMYDVCTVDYWKRAINLLVEKIENPLFFICSDNVNFVLKNIIDTNKLDYMVQDSNQPVHISLAAMNMCKHYIIGNTTFGWWAQYLSNNDDKIVIAPEKWMAIDMPIDIYQPSWILL